MTQEETRKNAQEEMHRMLFANLIIMLSSSAMQQLGKIVNPLTNKTEIDLDAAQMTIDMIEMLQAKTRDNCDDKEKKMISDILSSLQLNYVETRETESARKTEDSGQKTEDSGQKTEDSDASQ